MDHNLLPPFLVREASLFLDETPKFQSTDLSRNNHNHTIYDDETGMRIHLQLNGTFSYFPTRALTVDDQERWDEYPVVYLTPDSDQWDPEATHYADAEAAMLDSGGDIVNRDTTMSTVFDDADIAVMTAAPVKWDVFDTLVDSIFADRDRTLTGDPMDDDDDDTRLSHDGIRAQLSGFSGVHQPRLFAQAIF